MKFSYPCGAKPLEGYTIKRGIGVGGFGEVYFALSDAGKEVALKKIQRNLDIELRGVRQCLNLKHVNLISLWDIRVSQHGESWVVMEYVPGPSLRDVVEANLQGMPEEEVKRWFAATASGVAYLHEHGIVHRDLKPGNIFCDEDEQVIKIGDYGLSKFISCSRRSGQTESVGTFHYMAPEIGKGVYGKEIDIYALGIILYEMLTGEVPFDGESTQEIIMKHLTADPDVDIVPEEFQHVIAKSLRKDPELRFRSVPEMVAELPWPDLAEHSQKIISHKSLGPMGTGNGPRTEPDDVVEVNRQQASVDEDTNPHKPEQAPEPSENRLPPVIISGEEVKVIPDIVFGPLTDNSQYPTQVEVSRVSVHNEANAPIRNPVRPTIRKPASPKSEPIRILDDEPYDQPVDKSVETIGSTREQMAIENAEPIAQVVQTGFSQVVQKWNDANVSTPVKIGLLVIVGIVVIKNSQWLLPLALGLSLVYLVYYMGRLWLSDSNESASLSPRAVQRKKTSLVRRWISLRPGIDRTTELIGSLLVAALACIVFNLLGLALGGGILGSSIEAWATYAWLTLTSVVASWALLGFAKSWEHREGDAWLRRLVMVGLGLVVGAFAFYSASTFSVNLTELAIADVQLHSSADLLSLGIPVFPAYLIYFAGLFGILRWWRQADPVRKTRLSVLNVMMCLVWAIIFSHLLNVPLTANCIFAVVVSISVQLASPWIHPENREEIYAELSSKSLS